MSVERLSIDPIAASALLSIRCQRESAGVKFWAVLVNVMAGPLRVDDESK